MKAKPSIRTLLLALFLTLVAGVLLAAEPDRVVQQSRSHNLQGSIRGPPTLIPPSRPSLQGRTLDRRRLNETAGVRVAP